MSTPLFIRTPQVGAKAGATTNNPFTLFATVAEPVLVEEIRFVGAATDTNAAWLNVYLHDPDANSDICVQRIEIPAPGVAAFASVITETTICIPLGWSLKVIHTLADGGGNVNADIAACGGIVR